MVGGGFRGGGWVWVVRVSAAAAWEWVAAGFRGGGIGVGGAGFRAAAIGGGGFRLPRSVAVVSVRRLCRQADFAAAPLPSTVFAAASTRGSGIIGDFRCSSGARPGLGLRSYGYYDDYDYGYDDSYYYGDSGCYIVRRSVLTPYGWRIRPVQVCG